MLTLPDSEGPFRLVIEIGAAPSRARRRGECIEVRRPAFLTAAAR